ncbi:uncharacterized protein LOC111680102 isoform X1 [Lucilia cuprina]|uniref:uncharacterized protein LOC111680102 isoform X1 n=2 Tax=Lucilia cuprina TaxID=7375 RepID=UPI001F0678EF|nr:uncharacterized protein LOC111680102 isoform X1 [Lucilia cuprina]XP_046806771.1 uncharacterized protein LOC111680102 isoform X1 [Lucilia cuprina]
MDIHSNLEFLCRVCAVNTKGKNSVAECVYILKTTGLKDKLDKFLYLKISENDSLPKVLCKSCFRQVEATASLSKIAKDTQQVFREFLLSNLPKGPSDCSNTAEFTSTDFMGKPDAKEKSKKEDTLIQLPFQSPAMLAPPPPPIMPALANRKEEVVVNVSVSDPLTRDNQQKMISNSQRRQSLLLDSRYTPKSIAQKPATTTTATAQRVMATKQQQIAETTNTTNLPTTTTTTPTLNFYPIKQQQQQQTKQTSVTLQPSTQITTFSSGGYVIGRINSGPNEKEEPKKITVPLATTAENVLQQKRKNLAKALNNIKANNSGQVSLLKSSQQKQTTSSQNPTKLPLTEVVNQAAEDELPDKIIIAAPKNKSTAPDKSKKEPLNLSSKIAAVVTPVSQLPQTTTTATITAVPQQQLQLQQEQPSGFNNTSPKPAFPEDILLGRVIRDMDLLKLILKALKWPVNKQNMELQLQRLKNSKFTDIMSDTNLLQDTDLTQLLGPYLAPVLLAAQALQQQQHQHLKNTNLNDNMSAAYIQTNKMTALEAAQAEINKSIPYKLPPETSVQLVPATPEEAEPTPSPPLPIINTNTSSTSLLKRDKQKETKPVAVPPKRQRRAAAQRARDSIVISDEEEDASNEDEAPKKSRQRSSKSAANIQFDLNTNFMSQFNLLNSAAGMDANEALMALLQRQKATIMKNKKVQRRRRNSVSNLLTLPASEFDALIDLDDDIVLMEPVTTTSSSDTGSSVNNFEMAPQKTDASNTFVIPSVPLITRPIIKRRKTVIHSSRGRLDLTTDKAPISSTVSPSKEKLLEETINQVASGFISNTHPEVQTSSAKATTNENSLLLPPTDLAQTKVSLQKSNKVQSKSTLGQQLLEAIGLQKITPEIMGNAQTLAASSSSLTVMPNSKQSIQQIRTALKKSLKQAQEQQQLKKKELSSSSGNSTIIQDADSTTKPAVKEIVVVEGKGNKSDDGSSMVDVEEQIDKVTLMVRSNDKDNCGQLTKPTTTTSVEKAEKKEMKKSPVTKIQERRRTMPPMGGARGARNNAAKEKSNGEKQQPEEEEETESKAAEEENEKPEKEDNDKANISSSSSSKDASASLKEEVLTPKRRGRKRLIEKHAEEESPESTEKDNKTSPSIPERSRTFDKTKEEDNESNTKNEEETTTTASNKTSGRPTRQSKTLSKYYKGPDKPAQGRRSLPSRSTRNRKYS